MQEKLTAQQIYSREYYAKNAERIKAKKRAEYDARSVIESKVLPKVAKFNAAVNKVSVAAKIVVTPPPAPALDVSAEPQEVKPRELSARERIENLRIEKELHLDESEFDYE